MKRVIYIAFAAVAILMCSSCDRNLTTYSYSSDCAGAFFQTESIKYSMVKEDGNKIIVDLLRGNTKGDMSVSFEMDDYTEGVFTPEKNTFDFKDGENIASVAFSYQNIEDFLGEVYTFDLTIDPEQASLTGNDQVTVKAQRRLTLNPLGMAILNSEWYEDTWETEICNTEEAPNYYVLPDIYVRGKDLSFTISGNNVLIDEGQDVDTYPGLGPILLINITASIDGNVVTITGDYYIPAVDYIYATCTERITLPE